MKFGAILALVQGWSNQDWKYALLSNFSKMILKFDLGTHLREKHGHRFRFGQTKVEKMYFYWISRNWVLKEDLGVHLRDKHGNLFLWNLVLFFLSFKAGQTKVENMHFYGLSQKWNFKVDLDTHLREKHGHLFLWDLELFWPWLKVGQTKVEIMHFFTFSELSFERGFRYPFER